MYADDTKVSRVVGSIQDHTSLQTDLNEMHTWSDTWQLKFNSTKCKVMHVSYSNKRAKYSNEGSWNKSGAGVHITGERLKHLNR